jgi:short-subunit dehydrogenase
MNKKSVLISGGTKGIGKGAVLQLLEDGFNVATFSRDKNKLDSLQSELAEKYPQKQFLVLQADVNNEEELSVAVEKTIEKFETIDILINNAGIGYFADCDKVDMSRLQQMLQTNIVGLALLTKLVVPQMKQQKAGLIINLASISGKIAFANGEFYSATKFGVMGYSQGIRNELKDFGIKVATLCPGMIKTDFFDDEELERRKKIWQGKIPQMLDVEDIKRIISLICNQSKYCDIQDLTVMPF